MDGGDAGPTAGGQAVLRLQGVSKVYRQGESRVVALDHVDLSVAPGQLVALVGRSGSGKSTLLHVAGALDRPDTGRVTVGGRDVGAMSPGERARLRRRSIGFVFQFFQLVAGLTVSENVALPLTLDGRAGGPQRAAELLERVGLGGLGGRFPGELSGGQMQRVAVARALAAEPALVLADEPTGNLDTVTADSVLDLLTEQVRHVGAALVLATHDPDAVSRVDRVVAVRDGRLEPSGPPPEPAPLGPLGAEPTPTPVQGTPDGGPG